MQNFTSTNPMALPANTTELMSNNWMLVSAGNSSKFNTMTASWGEFGFYANKPTVMIFIRPERYTYEFIENNECFTLSFFSTDYKKDLTVLGTKSGRDGDKLAETSLTPCFTQLGNPAFEQAELVVECRKMIRTEMKEDQFIDKSLLDTWYNEKKGGLHVMYIAEIVNAWVK